MATCTHDWMMFSIGEGALYWCHKCGALGRWLKELDEIDIALCHRCDAPAVIVRVGLDELLCMGCSEKAATESFRIEVVEHELKAKVSR